MALGFSCALLFAAWLLSDRPPLVEAEEAFPLERYKNPNSHEAIGNIIFETDSNGAIAKPALVLDLKYNIGDAKIREGRAYFSDLNTTQIYCYDLRGKKIWMSAGKEGFSVFSKYFPLDISPKGGLWVVNPGKKRFDRLDLNTGEFLESWNPHAKFAFKGGDPVQIIAFDGGFATMEAASNSVRIFDMEGRAKTVASDLAAQPEFYKMHAEQNDIAYFDGKKNIKLKGALPNRQ